MKKLMLIVAVALAAIAANAASFQWKTSASGGAIYSDADTKLASGTAYLIDASVLTQAQIASGIEGGKTLSEVISGKTFQSATVSSGKINTTFEAEYSGSTATFYSVIVNGSNYFASDSVTVDVFDVGDTTVQFKLTTPTQAEGAWKPTSSTPTPPGPGPEPEPGTPEPTSGLLLLVGGAVLGLRRKQK